MASKKKAQEAKAKGNKFFLEKKFPQAIEWYTKAIQADSTDATFFSNRSAAYAGCGKWEEALSDAEKCINLKSDWVKGYYRKGIALEALYRYEEAANAWKKGLECEPANEDLKQKIAGAERQAKYAPKRFDENGNPLPPSQIAKEEGNVCFRNSQYELAIEKYTRAITLAKDENEKVIFYSNRATCYAQLQNHMQVVEDCTSSINIKPTAKALIRRGLAYEVLEKYRLALDDMRKVLELDPSAKVASETIGRLTRAVNTMY